MGEQNQTIIGAGAKFKGELTLAGGAVIQGSFEGAIIAEGQGELRLAPQSQTKASVKAATVLVEGQFDGDVLATERLQLTASARVTGELCAAALIVAEGATFTGKVAVGPDAVAASTRMATDTVKSDTLRVTSGTETKPASRTSVRLPDWAAGNGTAEIPGGRPDWMAPTITKTGQKSPAEV
jgi:cytoskeletal protein CcmA (bactofilin family)